MSGWSTFWQGLIVVSLAIFAVVSVVVTIGGARDVFTMFRRIDQQHEESREE